MNRPHAPAAHADAPDAPPAWDAAVLRDVTWWSWVAMIGLLVVRFTGHPQAILAAVTLCATLAGFDLAARGGNWRAMSVQIRLAYCLLLVLGLLPGMAWIHAVQLLGTSARVTTGYCLLERELRLLPWNRPEPWSARLAWRILSARPGGGGLLRFGAAPSVCALPLAARSRPGR